jgi:hypothetical protein
MHDDRLTGVGAADFLPAPTFEGMEFTFGGSEHTTVTVMNSRDHGKTWSVPRALAQTSDASDHPLLVSNGRSVFLSWMTRADGYRLLPVEAAP